MWPIALGIGLLLLGLLGVIVVCSRMNDELAPPRRTLDAHPHQQRTEARHEGIETFEI